MQVQAAPGLRRKLRLNIPRAGSCAGSGDTRFRQCPGRTGSEKPLAGLALCVAGTDGDNGSDGAASLNLPEGTYDAQLVYTGEGSVVLPFTQGQIIVRSGETTRGSVGLKCY